jgi:peptide deformylase
MKRDISLLGQPVLRQRAKEVGKITPQIKQLAQDLIDMARGNAGIAAPQIFESVRMFAAVFPKMDNKGEFLKDKEGNVLFEEPKVFLNPILSEPSEERDSYDEGCLSIPGIFLPIERPLAITIDYMDLEGKKHKKRYEGFIARILMHENDHLNGVLIVDRLSPEDKKNYNAEIQKLKKEYKAKGYRLTSKKARS